MQFTKDQIKQINSDLARLIETSRNAGLVQGTSLDTSETLVQALIVKSFQDVIGEYDLIKRSLQVLSQGGNVYDHPVDLYNIAVIVDDTINMMSALQHRTEADADDAERYNEASDDRGERDNSERYDANEETEEEVERVDPSDDDLSEEDEEEERRIIASILGEGHTIEDDEEFEEDEVKDDDDWNDEPQDVEAPRHESDAKPDPKPEEKPRPMFTTRRQSFTDNDL